MFSLTRASENTVLQVAVQRIFESTNRGRRNGRFAARMSAGLQLTVGLIRGDTNQGEKSYFYLSCSGMDQLAFYLKKFTHLKRATSKGQKARHKPILLLAVLRLMETNEIRDNKIYITPELVAAFKDYWQLLVPGVAFTPNFSLPFYHLRSEGFWHLHTYPGKEILLTSSHSIKSFAHLKDAVWFASLDAALYELLQNPQNRTTLQQTLLQQYFPAAPPSIIEKEGGLSSEIESQILNEAPATYRQAVIVADEETVFIRSDIFKRVVPAIYCHACCISRMQIISGYNIQMVDACHIQPFALAQNDSITNGIALCPNLHRAFDRGLLTISESYEVMISPHFTEQEAVYGIRQWAGTIIALPEREHHFPSAESLAWHRSTLFKY